MSDKNNTTVTEVDLDIDSLLNGADNVMLPDNGGKDAKNSIFTRKPKVDLEFLDNPSGNEGDDDDDDEAKKKAQAAAAAASADPNADPNADPSKKPAAKPADNIDDIINDATAAADDDDKTSGGRPRTDKNGLVEFTNKLIEKKFIVPFEEDKKIEDYTLKDFEELFEANMAERERKIQEQVPEEFFKSLPPQLQSAAQYVANGGTDLKGFFRSLAAVEEVRDLDPSNESDQREIVRSYLQATNFGDSDEIEEEIDSWADRNELEAKANKFKPKLDALSEQQVQYRLQQQEAQRAKQAQQAKVYMDNIYKALEPGELNGLKLDKKVQNALFAGLVQPNYQSVTGKPTNLLGHLLEKYQYVEPNHSLVAEALWLLSDPDGYKSKVKELTKKEVTTDTVRKLKTEEASRLASHVNDDDDDNKKKSKGKGIPRPSQSFFKRD